jgi:homoaconitate hydratase
MSNLTLIEKLATKHAVGLSAPARSGDFITIRSKHVMTHDNTGAVIPKFKQVGATKIHDPRQPVFAIDHDIQNLSSENMAKYAKIAAFAKGHGIDFYPEGTGIAHQIMVEQGYVVPGSMVVGSDSHSNLYGALCCLGTPVVRTDAASIWATGVTWWQVPPVARMNLRGKLRPGVTGKDVIVTLCGLFSNDEVLNHAVEFVGDGIASLSVEQRMTIANMTTEWGALVGLFPFDEALKDYLQARADYFAKAIRPGTRRPDSLGKYTRADVEKWWSDRESMKSDAGASYSVELELDLDTVTPYVCGPNDVKTMASLAELEPKHVTINKAWLMSCVNARSEDLAEAAAVIRGKKVASGVEFYLAAASAEVEEKARQAGHWQALVEAGAIELPPGCGTCIGLGRGTIKAGEVGISATNRNFEGRMGDRNGLVYLGSPAVVAASAIAGYLASPTKFADSKPRGSAHRANRAGSVSDGTSAVIDGFPKSVKDRLWFLDRDNLNTDGIYAGKHTYNDAMTPEQMAAVIFENYDPNLRSQLQSGDVIVSGYNFGTGSSREQAATALKFAGIPCVIAASFSETYKRNAFNNGFVVFECPELVEHLRRNKGEKSRLVGEIEIDYTRGSLTVGERVFSFSPLSPTAQELVVAGGAEAVVSRRLRQTRGV